jgi:hypothetical protein
VKRHQGEFRDVRLPNARVPTLPQRCAFMRASVSRSGVPSARRALPGFRCETSFPDSPTKNCEFVAAKAMVAAVDQRCCDAVFEVDERGARLRAAFVPDAGDRAHGTDGASVERTRDLDLVRDLVVHDAAARARIELCPTISAIPASSADAIMARHSPTESAIGFSTIACSPCAATATFPACS